MFSGFLILTIFLAVSYCLLHRAMKKFDKSLKQEAKLLRIVFISFVTGNFLRNIYNVYSIHAFETYAWFLIENGVAVFWDLPILLL